MKRCLMDYDPEQGHELERFYLLPMIELTIYGHTVDESTKARYPEDWEQTLWSRRHGREFACWHSLVCPEGELGYNPIDALLPIGFESFKAASEAGYPFLRNVPITTTAPVSAVGEIREDGTVNWVWDSLYGDTYQGPEND